MMDNTKLFTEEADDELETYLSEVAEALTTTELSDEEIEKSIEELRAHIIGHCEIKSTGNVISTDQVKSSIKKLGTPQTIAETLQSELNFTATIQQESNPIDKSSRVKKNQVKQVESSSFKIKAKHLTAIYGLFCWLITANVIFVIYSNEFYQFADILPFVYLTTIGMLIFTRNVDAYSYNNHLKKYVRPNFHTNIVPLIFIVMVYYLSYTINSWIVPAMFVLWLIISTTEYGRQYYIDLVINTKNFVEDKDGARKF